MTDFSHPMKLATATPPAAQEEISRGETPLHASRVRPVRFSIVTPTLNAAEYLTECLASVQSQAGPQVEIEHLVLDGGSTDGTLEILERFPVVRVPRRPDQHVVESMCLGFEAATGDFVSFLGADDLLLPGALDWIATTFRRESRPVVFCRVRWATAELKSLGELGPPPVWLTAATHACLGWNYLGAASSFVSPKVYRDLGGFDRSLQRGEDYEFYTRVLHRRVPFSRVDRPVVIYRRHGNNQSLQDRAGHRRDLQSIRERYGPASRRRQQWLEWSLKAWIYARNWEWAYHQLQGKWSALRGKRSPEQPMA